MIKHVDMCTAVHHAVGGSDYQSSRSPSCGVLGRVRRALENTCAPLGGNAPDAVLTYGRGLIQARMRLLLHASTFACAGACMPVPQPEAGCTLHAGT